MTSSFSVFQKGPLLCFVPRPAHWEGEQNQVQQGSGERGPSLQQKHRSVQGSGQRDLPVLLLHPDLQNWPEDRSVVGDQQLLGVCLSHSGVPGLHRW